MRVLLGLFLALAATVLQASPASASCRPPATLAENAGRAVAVVYGTVTASDGGALTVRVDRALKGQVSSPVRVFVGPGRVSVPGTAVATSVDYPDMGKPVAVGSDHVLYLVRGADGQLETNACIGSHAGPPDAAELAFFGAGASAPSAPPIPAATEAPAAPDPTTSLAPAYAWPLLVVAILGAAALALVARRTPVLRR